MRIPLNRLRLTLRALMVLIVLLAIPLAWQVNKARRQRDAVAAIKKYGGFVYYDWEYVGNKRVPGRTPPAPRWLRKILGDEFFQDVMTVDLVVGLDEKGRRVDVQRKSDDVIINLAKFPQLKRLRIQETQATDRAMETIGSLTNLEQFRMIDGVVSDQGMSQLKNLANLKELSVDHLHTGNEQGILTDATLKSLSPLTRLESLYLQNNRFSDEGLAHLRDMTEMKQLALSSLENGTDITDAGLVHLQNMKKLEFLALQGSKITDVGLDSLSDKTQLRELWIKNMGRYVSNDAIKKLQEKMPNLKSVR